MHWSKHLIFFICLLVLNALIKYLNQKISPCLFTLSLLLYVLFPFASILFRYSSTNNKMSKILYNTVLPVHYYVSDFLPFLFKLQQFYFVSLYIIAKISLNTRWLSTKNQAWIMDPPFTSTRMKIGDPNPLTRFLVHPGRSTQTGNSSWEGKYEKQQFSYLRVCQRLLNKSKRTNYPWHWPKQQNDHFI